MDVEKIICCDNPYGNAMANAAFLQNSNGFGNGNGLWFLLFLLLGGRGWNGWNNANNNGINTEFSLLQDQAQQNQNTNLLREAMRDNYSAVQQLSQMLNCDFNTLRQCCCDLNTAIAKVSGDIQISSERVINAAQFGDMNIIQQLKDCCCSTQKEILSMGYENKLAICQQTGELRNGQRDLGQAISQGFSQVGFQSQQDKCEIIRAGELNTQKILDTMYGFRSDDQAREIQDLKNQVSQLKQTEAITGAIFARLGLNNGNCGCHQGNCGCGF